MIYVNYVSQDYFHFKKGDRNLKVNGVYPPNTSIYTNVESRVSKPLSRLESDYYLTPLQVELTGRSPTTEQINRLYGKLREELDGQQGDLFTSAVEWRSSLDMISGRATQLLTAYSAVRRFRFKEAARILRINTPHKYKNLSAKSAKRQGISPTSAWLEYWMGWAPLHGDIAHAINTLQNGPPVQTRHFSVGVRIHDIIDRHLKGRGPNITNIRIHYERVGKYSAYGDVEVTNHNLHLANKMGFINPIKTAWAIVPFSFIVDWFVNIGDILGSLTDFAGLAFSNTGTAMMINTNATASGTLWEDWVTRAISQTGWSAVRLRSPGALPSPQLQILKFDGLSLTRGLTSISLLVESFLRK